MKQIDTVTFDLSRTYGEFKPLNCTNGGPWYKRHTNDQLFSNFRDYKALRMPYSRNHDSAMHGVYGGPHSHDITCIFPNFDADPEDPASYDFPCTDEAILATLDAGTRTFFRLGQTIEHQIKKYGTIPPKDFTKWAVICEHIIRHYTEGWNNGYTLDMPYWEIWNEPDLDPDDSPNKRTWGGTSAQFFDLFEITAKRLKARFPHLKIGGPAAAHNGEWAENFLAEMKRRNVPLDFYSWHVYASHPEKIADRARLVRERLDRYGYTKTESILNEYNYVRGWEEDFVYSLKAVHGIKGAAFSMAALSLAAASPIDMMMYYDTRPSGFNGMFDFYSCEKLKGYYPFYWFGELYAEGYRMVHAEVPDGLYALGGINKDGKLLAVVTAYREDDEGAPDRTFALHIGKDKAFTYTLLDADHDAEPVEIDPDAVTLKPCACLVIEERS